MTSQLIFSLLFFVATMNTAFITTAAAAQSNTAMLEISGMTCQFCPITVRKALEKVPGVSEAKVDYKTATATVSFDPDKATVESLTTATANAGFPSKLKR